MEKEIKKRGFPFGIFLFMLVLLLALSCAITGGYYYYSTRSGIESGVAYTHGHARQLAEALANLAELSHRVNDYTALKTLFREKIKENTIDEAFFVLFDGTLVAHSRSDAEKKLGGNIANDEFSYNTDLILFPLRNGSKEIQLIDYNIMGKTVPFNRIEKQYLKKYMYDRVDTSGWLVTRAVYSVSKGKDVPLGTVNFLISKERVFGEISGNFRQALLIIQVLAAVSFMLSLIIALVVYARYRNFYRVREIDGGAAERKTPRPQREPEEVQESVSIDADLLAGGDDSEVPWREKDGDRKKTERAAVVMRESFVDVRKTIRDAIPVNKRKAQG
jgi:hypothetical protein